MNSMSRVSSGKTVSMLFPKIDFDGNRQRHQNQKIKKIQNVELGQ